MNLNGNMSCVEGDSEGDFCKLIAFVPLGLDINTVAFLDSTVTFIFNNIPGIQTTDPTQLSAFAC